MEKYIDESSFMHRHTGPDNEQINAMLQTCNVDSLKDLIDKTVPAHIRNNDEMNLPEPLSEYELLRELKSISLKNQIFQSYIGLGYYPSITPTVIQRNIFENPGWYTQYTPYQAEISQGRLEALLNFQTMVADLTGLPIANASLLDEGTAAAEAMIMLYRVKNKNPKHARSFKFFVSDKCFPQTIDVLKGRAQNLNIHLIVEDYRKFTFTEEVFGALLQYPDSDGQITDYRTTIETAHRNGSCIVMAADLLSLLLLTPPGELQADVAVGNTQRFGIPVAFGGPHAAYFATTEKFVRNMPGRIIGISIDANGNPAYRMALQTREQHIRREKATSNICTAQALLAIMAGAYAVYHGPDGLKNIARKVHDQTVYLEKALTSLGYKQMNSAYFDTLKIDLEEYPAHFDKIKNIAIENRVNFRYFDERKIGISLDETTGKEELENIIKIFRDAGKLSSSNGSHRIETEDKIPASLQRQSNYLTHPVFHNYHSETKMMRYLKSLENKDLSLVHSMIPLGSCTMKLNASSELIPLSWNHFSNIHPFVPGEQALGYKHIIERLEQFLNEITGFTATSLQPNSGAQGEYTGLSVIRAYHRSRGDHHRNIALIPASAHGTNPASAAMAGLEVVLVKCDDRGNIDIDDLKAKAQRYSQRLAALMVTYPSTHGVFEDEIMKICTIIHDNGGQVYMDGANMNAQVGITSPAKIGADICHLNLHKTFAIPHGGGGPGVGPICAARHLAPFLPGHTLIKTGGREAIHAVASAPWGSAGILIITYAYIRMLGSKALRKVSEIAILNANYLRKRLEEHYPVLYTGNNGFVAHELILDTRKFKHSIDVSVEDIARRLMDYGFHAPTVSFPVHDTLMIEPTESEDKDELDRFCDAMIAIRNEIAEIENGTADREDNVLKNAPHTIETVTADTWSHGYSREKAIYPLPYLRKHKFWPPVSRINNPYGDRHLVCTCPPVECYPQVEV